jgi:hypothetical protein
LITIKFGRTYTSFGSSHHCLGGSLSNSPKSTTHKISGSWRAWIL